MLRAAFYAVSLIETWALMKSVKPKGGSEGPPAHGGGRNAEADFHGQKRSNQTHASTTGLETKLYRKGRRNESKLCFIGLGLMENRSSCWSTLADGDAERVAALHMMAPPCRPAAGDHTGCR